MERMKDKVILQLLLQQKISMLQHVIQFSVCDSMLFIPTYKCYNHIDSLKAEINTKLQHDHLQSKFVVLQDEKFKNKNFHKVPLKIHCFKMTL